MKYFDSEKNVKDYIKLVKGCNGKDLVIKLRNFLKRGSSLLELGMGPGVDLDILKKYYKVTGSDNSKVFLDLYSKKRKKVPLLQLDAITLKTKSKYSCIYSNKVLHHLTKIELSESLKRQKEVLLKNGLVMHSFWKGKKTEKYENLLFNYYMVGQLANLFEKHFEILEIGAYKEIEPNDSIYVIAKNR